jgi:hypothetical protein
MSLPRRRACARLRDEVCIVHQLPVVTAIKTFEFSLAFRFGVDFHLAIPANALRHLMLHALAQFNMIS